MSLIEEVNNIETGWKEVINDNIKQIEENFGEEYQKDNDIIYPEKENIFRCFNYFNPQDTKVVILGQDPYHGKGESIGLCFGVNNDSKKLPPSLKNIEKELMSDLGSSLTDYSLENWAKQGVLLMNTALTVRHKSPSSHIKIWANFTTFIIDYLNTNFEGIVFVAWGAHAYNQLKNININKHSLIVTSHPSPLSNYKKFKEYPSFKGSRPFTMINKLLKTKMKF